MTTREIVTLQIGHFANFVGTHWWNIQESSFIYAPEAQTSIREINHDVLFREGQTLHGEVTYTPRLVAVDLKGSLNTLRREGTLYESGQEEEVKWDADVALHEAGPLEKNEFLEDLDKVEAEQITGETETSGNRSARNESKQEQNYSVDTGTDAEDAGIFGRKLYNLDESVSVWSDFLHLHLHPKSLNIVQEYIHDNQEQPFDVFSFGSQVLKNSDTRDALENQIRFFVEESDQLQGFHTLLDWCDGFGGVGVSTLEHLADEYSSKACLTCGVSSSLLPDTTARERANRIINCALCLDKGGNLSSLFLPLSLSESLWKKVGQARSFPYLHYKNSLNYHTSAVLAATLDTMSQPYRRDGYTTHLSDITHSFSNLGRKVSALYSSLPFPLHQQKTFVETLLSHKDQAPWFSLTPNVGEWTNPYMQSCVVRGIPPNRVNRSDPSADIPRILSGCSSVDEVIQLYLSEMYPQCFNAGCVMRDPCKVVSPYPHIFSQKVSKSGFLADTDRPHNQGVDSVPVMTSLQSSGALYDMINSLHQEASRLNIKKHHAYLEAGLEEEEYRDTLDSLASLSQCYKSDTSIS